VAIRPTRQIWTEMAVAWSQIPEGLECFSQDGHAGSQAGPSSDR
jgi:hypothetical protein